MLSMRHMDAGSEAYYLNLAREDYYLNGGEPNGVWMGSGAKALGLSGIVLGACLRALLAGFGPNGNPLVQNAGRLRRQPGWDLTFSAPKSVSVLWALAPAPIRKLIESVHREAVAFAIEYIESSAALSRTGKAGAGLERVSLVVAAFEHGTSRAQDPHLHTHCLVANVGVGADGKTRALRSKDLYEHKMAAGAVYRAALAYGLVALLGLTPVVKRTWFELKEVPQTLVEFFSTRRQQIEDAMETRNVTGARAAAFVALDTRPGKQHAPRAELFPAWQNAGQEHSFTRKEISRLVPRVREVADRSDKFLAEEHVRGALKTLQAERSHFLARDLVLATFARAQDGRTSPKELATAINRTLGSRSLVRLGKQNGHELFTTRALHRIEQRILSIADLSRKATQHRLSRAVVKPSLDHSFLDTEQRDAVAMLTMGRGEIALLSGPAGTGKTRTLLAAHDAWVRAGYRVIGTALSGKASRELEHGSRIPSCTIAALALRLESKPLRSLTHHAVQLARAARKRRTFKLKQPLRLDGKTVLVIDEAAMVGTRDMCWLLARAKRAGAKVVLVGDERQLPSIAAGAPFAALAKRVTHARLTTNRRQQRPWQIEASRHLAEGDTETGLGLYARYGRLVLKKGEQELMSKLIDDWTLHRTRRIADTLILAGTNQEAKLLNLAAQECRQRRGELGNRHVLHSGTRYREGDRILFTENSSTLGIMNGELGIIERITKSRRGGDASFTIRLDTPRLVTAKQRDPLRVQFRLRDYGAMTLGYAATTHKAQGATVERTFVYIGSTMADRELTYVQLTRHRNDCGIYALSRAVGDDLQELCRRTNRSNQKRLAHEVQLELQR